MPTTVGAAATKDEDVRARDAGLRSWCAPGALVKKKTERSDHKAVCFSKTNAEEQFRKRNYMSAAHYRHPDYQHQVNLGACLILPALRGKTFIHPKDQWLLLTKNFI